MKAAFNIRLDGYGPANRDATVKLTEEATGAVIERKPFLDGDLTIRDLDPGMYEVEVRHPNLILPIDKRRVRLFPQPAPTPVYIPVPADLFRDSPIRDIPDADLRPVQQAATTARDQVRPIASKAAGEAIRASDWNTMASAVADLANAVLQLTQLVSPRGHDHAEIAEKIAEVQGNVQRFGEAFGRSLLELRREIEADHLHRSLSEVLTLGGASSEETKTLVDKVKELPQLTLADTPRFTQKTALIGREILTKVNELAVARGADGETFRNDERTKSLVELAGVFAESGVQAKAENELQLYQRTSVASKGNKLALGSRIG